MKPGITEFIRTPEGRALEYFHEGEDEFLQTQTGIKYPIYKEIICVLDNISLTGNNENFRKCTIVSPCFMILPQKYMHDLKVEMKKTGCCNIFHCLI